MGKIVLNMVVSLDGYTAGPNDEDEGLHDWVFSPATREWSHSPNAAGGGGGSGAVLERSIAGTGAVVMGKRMHDIGDQVDPNWDGPYKVPHFVVTHAALANTVKGGFPVNYVDGVASAIEQARQAAGDLDVTVIGGANVAKQCIEAGLLDELHLHTVPLLLGKGLSLFGDLDIKRVDLEIVRAVHAPDVTHVEYRVAK
jgi:dihydrofolate reductase